MFVPHPSLEHQERNLFAPRKFMKSVKQIFLFMDLLNFFLSSALIDQAIFYILREKQLH